ncbi:VIT1/CCC1 transporter family protein [Ruicaihuangia caeni]|uniref:VIT1/CCC1 transporter family protein n=1 Tax=Ruicaihuangia caeni TaxID=3042517 RepID=A0AAW6T7H8_9MICO|nr:VIT1/CCC1 transporter family protein [Klugiella sp. YN-L-19]MDI2097758.1 VIT1/CCC1 transporter family protein [Klugiella sp. YN-L-19]
MDAVSHSPESRPGEDSTPSPHVEQPPATPTAAEIRRWRRYLADERAEGAVYRDLAERRTGEEREILLGLAAAEQRHEAHWLSLLGEHAAPARKGALRTRLLGWFARRFGSVFVLALAQRAESRSPYATEHAATPAMAADERIHEEVVRALATQGRTRLAGNFRAAVFGANDGLVSNLALVLGIGATGVSPQTVLFTGIAGLLAGALSMGAGEYVSVSSQRELLRSSEPHDDAEGVVPRLDVDANELTLVYRARGMTPEDAELRARQVIASHTTGATGPVPLVVAGHDAVGSGMAAAVSSFLFFASGAIIPVLPYLFGLSGFSAVIIAAALVGVALLITGAIVGVLSGASPLARALRQLAIGFGAAAVTYVLGLAFGAVLA